MSVLIVTTTINKPILLEDYCKNAKSFSHKDLNFIIIGDKKTPEEVGSFCRDLQKRYGFEVIYYNVEDQLDFLKDFPELRDHLPFNSIQRRNIGMLKAYLLGSETIITIDDDNFVVGNQDFIGLHSIVGKDKEFLSLKSSSGWFNICEMLEEENNLPFYPRGYLMGKRWVESKTSTQKKKGKIVVNAGLWLDDPDIDALTRINLPIRTKKLSDRYSEGLALDIGTWSPFNSQNTAMSREVIPAYFLSPNIGRYDDIWAGYVVKRITDYLGHYIYFGNPLVEQKRNVHNLWKDLDKERFGLERSDEFVDELKKINLTGHNYIDCFSEIAEGLGKSRIDDPLMDSFVSGLKIWSDIFKRF